MNIFNKITCSIKSLFGACKTNKSNACCDKEQREHLSEKQIDKTVKDSFPASDPPSTY